MFNFGPSSEEAVLNRLNGIETDPVLADVAKAHGVKTRALLKKMATQDGFQLLTHEEKVALWRFSSCPFDKQAEREMIEEFRHDRDYLNTLFFNHNTRACTIMAHRYYKKYLETAVNPIFHLDDFISAARYGLWEGAKKYDPDFKKNGEFVKFLSYAVNWIFCYISKLMYKKENSVPHEFLDAPVFDQDRMKFGDIVGNEGEAPGEPSEPFEFSEEDEIFEQHDNGPDYDYDDIDNAGFSDEETEDSSASAMAVSSGFDFEGYKAEETDARRSSELLEAAKSVAAKDGPVADVLSAVEAVDDICRRVFETKDRTERMITLFVARKFIDGLVSKYKDQCSQAILDAAYELKYVPKTKMKLFRELNIDKNTFDRLCVKFTHRNLRRQEA